MAPPSQELEPPINPERFNNAKEMTTADPAVTAVIVATAWTTLAAGRRNTGNPNNGDSGPGTRDGNGMQAAATAPAMRGIQ
jgi:hypothetical protein